MVLFIDDEISILPEYQEFLELHGFASIIESNPHNAVETVLDRPDIRLVITDLRMSGLNGVELIKTLRQRLPANRHIAFLILTGDREVCLDHEQIPAPILHKPIDPDALLYAVINACEEKA